MTQSGLVSCQTKKNITKMDTIEFIPQEFHSVELGLYKSGENICTPYYPDFSSKIPINQLVINIPQKIICHSDSNTLVIPLCGAYVITERRGLKYAHLSTPIIHVRKVGEETWYSGELVDPNLRNEYPDLPPNYYEEEAKRQQRIKEAQKYTDAELDENVGQSHGSAININIVDFVNISFEEGAYEVYLSKSGLESNRVKVEIVYGK
jgi:hypothetical protein